LCAADFSDPSLAALAFGCSLARELGGALTILRGADSKRLLPGSWKARCALQPAVCHGKPYVEILRVAEEISADLIVIAVHGQCHRHDPVRLDDQSGREARDVSGAHAETLERRR
jgi:isopentenyldiphosphate isomerase